MRLRSTCLMFTVATLAFATAAFAQGPGGGRGNRGQGGQAGPGGGGPGGPGGGPGGFGGRGGPGGGFGGGFGGPGGGGPVALLQNEAVQKELNLTEKQIEQIKAVNEASSTKRQALMEQMRGPNNNNGGGRGNGGNNAAGGRGNGGNNGNNGGGNNGGGRGNRGQNNGGGGAAAPGGAGGGAPGGPGGFGGRNFDPNDPAVQQRMAQFQLMRESMDKLTKDTETAIGKILDTKQKTRLLQIDLQRKGPQAFAEADLAKRLNIDEAKFAEIQEILNGSNQANRQAMRENFTEMAKLMPQDANGRPDFAKMREMQDDKAFQAQMTKFRETSTAKTESMRDETTKRILKTLTKKQQTSYIKMLGEKFDIASLNRGGGFFGGRGGPGGPGGPGAPGAAGARGGNTNGTAAPAPAGDAAAPSNATSPARKSLRERRGIGAGAAGGN